MSEVEELHINQCEAWIKTQQASIDSCDLNIKHFREQIEMLMKHIRLEEQEKVAKQKSLDMYVIKLDEYKKEAEKE